MEPRPLRSDDLLNLHDAELRLIAMDRENSTLQLEFWAIGKKSYRLFFERVTTFRIDNVQYQNVVAKATSGDIDVERLVRWVSSSGVKNDLLISDNALHNYIMEVKRGDLKFFYVEPSWGAEIGVLAGNISVTTPGAAIT